MPIIAVEAIGSPAEFPKDMAQRIADSVADALKTGPRDTWVKIHFLAPDHYAENDASNLSPERPLVVSILKYTNPVGAELSAQIAELTSSIATASCHPRENVHLIYEAEGKGRVAFGGVLAE